MIEYLLLQQLYQKPNFDFQASVQQALAQPKASVVISPQIPLEQRVEQTPQRTDYNLDQVKDILSKPYLSFENSNPVTVYDDLIKKGNAIKYAMNNFSVEEVNGLGQAFGDYRLNIIIFQLEYGNLALTAIDNILKNNQQKQEYINQVGVLKPLTDELVSMRKDIVQLMKVKGIN